MAGVGLALTLAAVGCVAEPRGELDYTTRLEMARRERDAGFRSQSDLIADGVKDRLLPLVYFPPDSEYNVPATLKRSGDTKPLPMVYSDGVIRDVRLDSLFVPFGDLTNGPETYQGGRYLDLERTASGVYELDFNRAYHPFCLFNPTYDCPYPPPESRLKVPIRAGERLAAPKR